MANLKLLTKIYNHNCFPYPQISVSVTSLDGAAVGCSRAYSVSSASGAVTRLAIAVSFENSVRDGPLLYLLDDTQVNDSKKI